MEKEIEINKNPLDFDMDTLEVQSLVSLDSSDSDSSTSSSDIGHESRCLVGMASDDEDETLVEHSLRTKHEIEDKVGWLSCLPQMPIEAFDIDTLPDNVSFSSMGRIASVVGDLVLVLHAIHGQRNEPDAVLDVSSLLFVRQSLILDQLQPDAEPAALSSADSAAADTLDEAGVTASGTGAGVDAVSVSSPSYPERKAKGGMVVLGRVWDVFGPVQKPFYSVRVGNSEEAALFSRLIDAEVYYVKDLVSMVLTQPLKMIKGSDASNVWDEEVGEEDQDFSDDEKEMQAKRKRKSGKAPAPGEPSDLEEGECIEDDEGSAKPALDTRRNRADPPYPHLSGKSNPRSNWGRSRDTGAPAGNNRQKGRVPPRNPQPTLPHPNFNPRAQSQGFAPVISYGMQQQASQTFGMAPPLSGYAGQPNPGYIPGYPALSNLMPPNGHPSFGPVALDPHTQLQAQLLMTQLQTLTGGMVPGYFPAGMPMPQPPVSLPTPHPAPAQSFPGQPMPQAGNSLFPPPPASQQHQIQQLSALLTNLQKGPSAPAVASVSTEQMNTDAGNPPAADKKESLAEKLARFSANMNTRSSGPQ
ncbi:hypothetical protein HDU91_004963 [Kappamyces sp. JEL0680]|nr:hypothetical protein HDU91_004963 [Kappamyces sp. JEL0680]